jgi:carboxylate-amine ligase
VLVANRFPRRHTARSAGRALTAWARWNGEQEKRYTLGIEEELMLLDPGTWSLSQTSDQVLAGLSPELALHASPETHAGVLELTTGVHRGVEAAVAELAALRQGLANELQTMGLAVAASGTHPLAVWQETEVSGALRYRRLEASMRMLARREPTMALHVHVGVPEPEDAVKVLGGLRRNLPILLALSGNSPFCQGRDSGFASARTPIFQGFPRTGPPRFFASYADYVQAVEALVGSTAIRDPSFLWWDVRLQPRLGTVEVRVMDAQSTLTGVAALGALIQALARLELEGHPAGALPSVEVLAENRFLGARDGMEARLIDADARRLIPAREMLEALLDQCRPHALALGCAASLEGVQQLAEESGADRQRAIAAGTGAIEQVVPGLAGRFLASTAPV